MQARDEGHPHRCQHRHRWHHTGPTAVACGIPAYDRESGNLPSVRAELCPLCTGREEVLIRGRHAHHCMLCDGDWGRAMSGRSSGRVLLVLSPAGDSDAWEAGGTALSPLPRLRHGLSTRGALRSAPSGRASWLFGVPGPWLLRSPRPAVPPGAGQRRREGDVSGGGPASGSGCSPWDSR
jgi:hypothetical protein